MNQTNNKILVSIITPCYNAASYIRQAIQSVQNQTLADWEMIIVDDGSTDNSAEIIRAEAEQDSRIKLVQKENGGTASARKLGLEVAQGDYVQFLDADDSITKDKLQLQIAFMEDNQLDVSYTDWRTIDQTGKQGNIRSAQFTKFRLLLLWGIFCTLPIHALLYRRDFLLRHHITIPTHIREREDWDFHIEVLNANPQIKRMNQYCGALYTKTPTGKATGASPEKLQLGNLRYLIHKIANASGCQKFLLQVRLSAELEFWMLRKYKYHYGSLKQALDINNREVQKICIIAILLFPISLTITLAKIILSRI